MSQNEDLINWAEHLCDDIIPVIQFLEEEHRITGWRADTDSEGRWVRIYLNKNPSPKVISKLRAQLANSPQIQVYSAEVRCTDHQIRLLPRRIWALHHGQHINGQPIGSFIANMALLLLFITGGFFLIWLGDQQESIRNIFVGLASILFFGGAFIVGLRDLIRHIRKK